MSAAHQKHSGRKLSEDLTTASELQMTYPPDFMWGVATSSIQVEGAWNTDGKGPSIWDTFCHRRLSPIIDQSTADVACNSYELYEADIQMLRRLNVTHYRLSLSWPRIMPNGEPNEINEAGVAYYNNVINRLIECNIKPMVTLYHWELPQALQARGGWINRQIVDWFTEYARFCYQTFGDRVKYWITVNEPWVTAWFAHGDGHFAPGLTNQATWAPYLVSYHQLLAHAHAYHCYDDEFRHSQHGMVSLASNCCWPEPSSNNPADVQAAERAAHFEVGLFAHPVHSEFGGWPPVIERLIAVKSKEEGLVTSRLPAFSEEERKMLQGSADFFGLNYYHMSLCSATHQAKYPYITESGAIASQRALDTDCVHHQPSEWMKHGGPNSWVTHNPEGLRKVLGFIRSEYNDPVIIITENGCPSEVREGLNDFNRMDYIHDHLVEIWRAMQSGSRIKGYFIWSLMDNFEWASGYTYKFGLFHVDFDDPKRPRTARRSVDYVAKTIAFNAVIPTERPRSRTFARYATEIENMAKTVDETDSASASDAE